MISESGKSSGVHTKAAPARFLDSVGESIDAKSSACGNSGHVTLSTGTATAVRLSALRLAAGDRGSATRKDVNFVRRRPGMAQLVRRRRRGDISLARRGWRSG